MSFLFFKSAIIADRPLRITEGFFNLLILLPRRAGAYLSMTRSEHFSSWLCSSSWFLHICRSRDGFFSLFSGVHTAEKETFGHERLQEQDKQPPAQQQRGFPVPLCPRAAAWVQFPHKDSALAALGHGSHTQLSQTLLPLPWGEPQGLQTLHHSLGKCTPLSALLTAVATGVTWTCQAFCFFSAERQGPKVNLNLWHLQKVSFGNDTLRN